jgi:large subunit ribosomal protein L1
MPLDHEGGIMAKPASKTKNQQKQVKQAELVVETSPAEASPDVKLEIKEEPVRATAKAGKRSSKAVKHAEEMKAKAIRKAEGVTEAAKQAKPNAKPSRSKLERAGKRYQAAAKLIDKAKSYSLAEALALAVKTANTKFDSTVEMHINLGVDPRQADQNVRATVALPAGTGKTVRVAAIADEASAEKLFAKLDKEEIDFDVLIATPAMMPKLGKYARLLGPRGLMPNPKSGTVTPNVDAAVKEAKAGRIEYRVDQSGIIHLAIGKASFGPEKLNQNAEAVLTSVRSARPASLKGTYVKSVYLTTTMGPSVKIDYTAA